MLCVQFAFAQSKIEGRITSQTNEVIPFANVIIEGTSKGTSANQEGYYLLENLPKGTYNIKVSYVGFVAQTKTVNLEENQNLTVNFQLKGDTDLEEVEVFGSRFEHPDKIEALTRLPLAPYEQIQSISIISDKLIMQQGNLTISEATKNVPGVYTFATYGNKRESMSSRGFRGIPILKNGVRVHSDFRGVGIC